MSRIFANGPRRPRVVMLVDSKKRDLQVAALIAHHLDALGLDCVLEPLEAYQAALAAHRPELVLFNHLTASHLAKFSRRLHGMGVLTAVLLNEGIVYDPDDLKYSSGKFHADAHIDLFFCWNQPHRQVLQEQHAGKHMRIEVVGVPRFDFYIAPWSRAFRAPQLPAHPRPRILLCTNFQLAKFAELPAEHGQKLFSQWKDRIPLYRDYPGAIAAQAQASRKIFDYLDALAADGGFDVILRPHPRESAQRYLAWHSRLPAAQRERVQMDDQTPISSLILDCDLEISCETCTTAMESWIAGKPTIELIFTKHPILYHPEHAQNSTPCDAPARLVPLIRELLQHGEPPALEAAQQRHLAKWCHVTDGNACLRLAQQVATAVRHKPPADWSQLGLNDRRRGLKLKWLRALGLPYNFDPLMALKMRLNPGRYAIKYQDYQKAITAADVRLARTALKQAV